MAADARTACLVHGVPMLLDMNEAIQRAMALGDYEPTQSGWLRRHLGPGSTFVDVGANFGHFTALAASLVGHAGRIVAFEPSAHAFAVLEATFRPDAHPEVILVNAAVGRADGEVTLYMPTTEHLHSPSVFRSDASFVPARVPMVALDTVPALQALDRIDLLKIDVEGSEPDVVDGMRALAGQGKIRRVMCEFNSWWLAANNATVESLQRRFAEMGFTIEDETVLQKDLPAAGGGVFDLQDLLYVYRG